MNDLWKIADVAAYLRCHTQTIYRMAEAREIPSFKVGSSWRFAPLAIKQWCDELHEIEVQQAIARNTQNGG